MHNTFLCVIFISTAIASPLAQWGDWTEPIPQPVAPLPAEQYIDPHTIAYAGINPPESNPGGSDYEGAGQDVTNPLGSIAPNPLKYNYLLTGVPSSCAKNRFYCCTWIPNQQISDTLFPTICTDYKESHEWCSKPSNGACCNHYAGQKKWTCERDAIASELGPETSLDEVTVYEEA